MAITITLDDANNSQLDRLGNSGPSVVRGGWAEGLPTDTTTMTPEEVLMAVMDAVYAVVPQGQAYPGRTDTFFNRVQVIGNGSVRAQIRLIYEPFQGVGTSLIIDVGATLSTYQTNMMPGTKELISVDYTPADESAFFETIQPDYPIVNMLRPLRRRAVTQLKVGTLDADEADAFENNIGLVNDATWRGKSKGAWIVSGAQASISRYSGYYQTRLEALCQGTDLWSYYVISRSNITGKYAADPATLQPIINTLKANPYTPQKVWKANGVTRVDPYSTTNFTALFGF